MARLFASYDAIQSVNTRDGVRFTVTADWHDIQIIYWDQGGEAIFKPLLGLVSDFGTINYKELNSTNYEMIHDYSFVTSEDESILISKETLLLNDTDRWRFSDCRWY